MKYTPGAALVVAPKMTKQICELEQNKISETTGAIKKYKQLRNGQELTKRSKWPKEK